MPEDKDSGGFIGHLWDAVRGFFNLQWKDYFVNSIKFVPEWLASTADWLNSWFKTTDDPMWDWLIQFLKDQDMMTPELEKMFEGHKDLYPIISVIWWLLMSVTQIGAYGMAVAPATTSKIRQRLNEELSPELADPAALIRTAMIAPEKIEYVIETLHKWGFSDTHINTLFISNYRLYDDNVCRELFLRGILSADQLFVRMRELGFTDTRTKEMMQAWEIIPGPQDLFHMVAKEAFEPEMISHIGLGDEFPEEQLPWLAKQGISRFWAEKYWFAHWDQPSVQMGYTMLHRGVIDEKELDMLFRAIEMPPFWRDKLKQISYLPYTRVDIRRMFDLGIVEVEEVYENYKDLGYDDEHALQMTKFTIAYVDPEDKNLSKSEVLSAYIDKILTNEECFALLRNLGFKPDQVAFLIATAEYDAVKSLEGKKIKVIKDRFVLRLADKFETLRELSLLDLESARVDLLLEQWDIELFKDNKIPSKTDLEKFWLNDIITEVIWHEEMDKIGYSEKYRGWYFDLMKTKKGEA